ncbi:hypothetical protein H6758_01795 [Candidatus Nomurabacteria bacterium]|nr:hypothetical protein [Candidatus Nomurabacteria bacterium]
MQEKTTLPGRAPLQPRESASGGPKTPEQPPTALPYDQSKTKVFASDEHRLEAENLSRLRELSNALEHALGGPLSGDLSDDMLHVRIASTVVTIDNKKMPIVSALLEIASISRGLHITLEDIAGPNLLRYTTEIDKDVGAMFLQAEDPNTAEIDLKPTQPPTRAAHDEPTMILPLEQSFHPEDEDAEFQRLVHEVQAAIQQRTTFPPNKLGNIVERLKTLQKSDQSGKGQNERRLPPDVFSWMQNQEYALNRMEAGKTRLEAALPMHDNESKKPNFLQRIFGRTRKEKP